MADWWDAALREATEVTEGTVLQEKRRNGDERRSLNHEDHEAGGRSMGRRRRPAAMYESANTNRSGVIGGLYLRSRTSRLSACFARRPIERPLSVRLRSSVAPVKPLPPSPPSPRLPSFTHATR